MRKATSGLGKMVILVSFILISCENVSNNYECNLNSIIEEFEHNNDSLSKYEYLATATYKGETVFYFGNCNPLINSVSFVVNCNGDVLGNLKDMFMELDSIYILLKHEEFLCDFSHLNQLDSSGYF